VTLTIRDTQGYPVARLRMRRADLLEYADRYLRRFGALEA